MCDSVRVVIALVAAFAPKRFNLPGLGDGLLSLAKQIGDIHRGGWTLLTERRCMDLFASWSRWLHHPQDVVTRAERSRVGHVPRAGKQGPHEVRVSRRRNQAEAKKGQLFPRDVWDCI